MKINLLSNIIGNALNALLGIVFIPIFIRYIGTEGYGLMGIFTSIQTVLYLFDLGLSTTLNRELARLSAFWEEKKQEILNTTRTFEIVFWSFSVVATLVAFVLSYFFAYYWVNPIELSRSDIFYYFILLSLSFGLMLPKGLYYGGLLGIQKHLAVNIANVSGVAVRNIGALLVLIYIEASPKAFFQWQVVASFFQTALMAFVLWKYLPKGFFQAQFEAKILRGSQNFFLGLTGISLTAIVITQADKFILSKIISLKEFGYYTFGALIGAGLLQLISALFQTYFPKLTQDIAQNDIKNASKTYHQASKIMALSVLPLACTILFFAKPIVEIWTKNRELIENTPLIMGLLTLGTAINGLVNIPYALSLAHGKPNLFIKINILFLVVLIPALIISALQYGSIGAAWTWLIINVLYASFSVIEVHKNFLQKESVQWFLQDIAPILSISFLICGLGAWLMPIEMSEILRGVFIGIVFLMTCVICGFVTFRSRFDNFLKVVKSK